MFFYRRNLINALGMPIRHGAHKFQDCTLALHFCSTKNAAKVFRNLAQE